MEAGIFLVARSFFRASNFLSAPPPLSGRATKIRTYFFAASLRETKSLDTHVSSEIGQYFTMHKNMFSVVFTIYTKRCVTLAKVK